MAARPRALRALELSPQLTPEQVASELGLTRYQVYRQLAEGIIPHQKVGKRYVIFRADLERLTRAAPESGPLAFGDLVGRTLTLEINGIPLTIRIQGVR